MHHRRSPLLITLALTALTAPALSAPTGPGAAARATPTLPALLKQAKVRVSAAPRVELRPEDDPLFRDLQTLEAGTSGRVPSYLRAAAEIPGSVKPMASLVQTVFSRGTVAPELKAAMGLRIAQIDASPYVALHLHRLLQATENGRRLGRAAAGKEKEVSPAEAAALSFADTLGRGPRDLSDEEFQKVRAWYNDSQVVELTVLVSFTSFFTRYCEGLNLPVERWALETPAPALPSLEAASARVSLLTEDEAELFREVAERAAAERTAATPDRRAGGLGLGVANSQRAMSRAPALRRAWFDYWASARESQVVDREHKLQVSFAVSMVNGCRYCTVHQVVGLRRQGVDPAKLLAMRKDDSALTPRERAAVTFARKLTRAPASVSDADYRALAAEFGSRGAFELLIQTACFNFMNRFTDGLRLPSEDEAIRIYQEVYGTGSYAGYAAEAQPTR